MKESTLRKINFCTNLMSIRNRVIKSDGSLAGGKKNHFDVSDIDLTRVWQSMTGNTPENTVAKEAVQLLESDAALAHILITMARNAKASLEQLGVMVSDLCQCKIGVAQAIVKCMKENGMDSEKVMSVFKAKVCRGGIYSVRGVPFGPEMAPLVSDAIMISARANCDDMIEMDDKAKVLDILTDAFNAKTAASLAAAYYDLQKLDSTMTSNGSATSITGHATRIAYRFWFQQGICPEFMRETLSRIVVKTAMSLTVDPCDRELLMWAFDSASDLAEMVGRGLPVSMAMVKAASNLHSTFDAVYSKYNSNDVFSYTSLMFKANHETLSEVSKRFAAAEEIMRVVGTGADPDDVNSITLNRPVTKQVGGATVHTGSLQPDLFEDDKSAFDELI